MRQYPHEFVNAVYDFYVVLRELHRRDPEQELQGAALIPYNSILTDAKTMFKYDEMIQSLPEIVTADNIENEVYPRVADTLVVISQIWSSLGTGRGLPV